MAKSDKGLVYKNTLVWFRKKMFITAYFIHMKNEKKQPRCLTVQKWSNYGKFQQWNVT